MNTSMTMRDHTFDCDNLSIPTLCMAPTEIGILGQIRHCYMFVVSGVHLLAAIDRLSFRLRPYLHLDSLSVSKFGDISPA